MWHMLNSWIKFAIPPRIMEGDTCPNTLYAHYTVYLRVDLLVVRDVSYEFICPRQDD